MANGNQPRQKVVLVTGASSGIGEATAIEYAKLGYKVAITGRNEERLAKVLEQLFANSPSRSQNDFLSIKADFDDATQVDPVVEQTISKFKRLDILVNNAGFIGKKHELKHPDFYDDFQSIIQVNLMAAVRISQLAHSHLVESRGVVVNVSSIADRLALPAISYSISKAGLSMLTKTLANALDGTGVRFVTVSPGPVLTNIVDASELKALGQFSSLHRTGTSQEVADLIVFLSSDKASYITGCTVDVDGGFCTKFGGVFNQHKELLE